MLTRTVPSTCAQLPVIGCGTWRGFDVGANATQREALAGVIKALFEAGGSVIDSSPMYGHAEGVVGDLLAQAGTRDKAFLATKVWISGKTAGIAQMQQSLKLLRTDRIDLMQVHNLLDWQVHLVTLRSWKKEGRIGYLGVTHYASSAYADLEAVMRAETLDFVQLNYALDDREAEKRILPLAADRGMAVLVNRPFGGGGLLRRLAGKPLPQWAGEIGCRTWSQVLLKFVLGHPSTTCAIPGTSSPDHMRENTEAGSGVLPDAALRARMVAAVA
jgi:diketogulonate reductase-like aldo/keto reductase